jgi:hypothetical protein
MHRLLIALLHGRPAPDEIDVSFVDEFDEAASLIGRGESVNSAPPASTRPSPQLSTTRCGPSTRKVPILSWKVLNGLPV